MYFKYNVFLIYRFSLQLSFYFNFYLPSSKLLSISLSSFLGVLVIKIFNYFSLSRFQTVVNDFSFNGYINVRIR